MITKHFTFAFYLSKSDIEKLNKGEDIDLLSRTGEDQTECRMKLIPLKEVIK